MDFSKETYDATYTKVADGVWVANYPADASDFDPITADDPGTDDTTTSSGGGGSSGFSLGWITVGLLGLGLVDRPQCDGIVRLYTTRGGSNFGHYHARQRRAVLAQCLYLCSLDSRRTSTALDSHQVKTTRRPAASARVVSLFPIGQHLRFFSAAESYFRCWRPG